jgi:aspartate 1-decarboxylase
MSYANMTPEEAQEHKPTIVILDSNNQPKEILHETKHGLTYEF